MVNRQEELISIIKGLTEDIEALENYPYRTENQEDELEILSDFKNQLEAIDLDISFHEALDIVLSEDDWMEYVNTFTPNNIAGAIATLDGHRLEHLASILANGPDLDVAKRLYQELDYWNKQGRLA